ncbi:MAG: beta-N-acetylglucosaminidase domain-containing protein [bacterium]|nr:beta-N-acetylglucosaminidase domain-containing protein [bacterium]
MKRYFVLMIFLVVWFTLSAWAQTDARENIIPNPGFEDGVNSPKDWVAVLGRGDMSRRVNLEWTSEHAHSGERSLKISATENPGRTLGWMIDEKYQVEVKGGSKLKVSAWMKTDNVVMGETDHNTPVVVLRAFDAGGKILKQYWIARAVAKATDWTKYESQFQLPDSASRIQLLCGLSCCTGTAWFDDLSVIITDDRLLPDAVSSALSGATAVGEITRPIIIPQPWKEHYGQQTIPLKKITLVVGQNSKDARFIEELCTFLKDKTREETPVLSLDDDLTACKNIILAGRHDDTPLIGEYLRRFKIPVNWSDLGDQGYVLSVGRLFDKNVILLIGNTWQGVYYAVQSFKQYLVSSGDGYMLLEGTIIDKPDFIRRGLVPGTMSLSRIDKWMVPLKMNIFFGPSHNVITGSYEWWKPFTDAQKGQMADFVRNCEQRFIIPVAAVRPDRGYTRRIRFSDPQDIEALKIQLKDYYGCGFRCFHLAFDDGPIQLEYAEDKKNFAGLAAAHYSLADTLYRQLKSIDQKNRLYITPKHYNNPLEWSPGQRDYMKVLSALPQEVVFNNAGVSTAEAASKFVEITGRKPFYWDNWATGFETMKPVPVIVPAPAVRNDRKMAELTQGYMFPLIDKEMIWYLASDYMWNASRFDPQKSVARAAAKIFGSEALQKLQNYQKLADETFSLALSGDTREERLLAAAKLTERFKQGLSALKGVILDDFYQEIETGVTGRIQLLEKVLIPQLQEKPFPVDVYRVDRAPVIDGRLNDACWKTAVTLEGFSMPLTGAVKVSPAREQTEARLCCDDKYLYIAFICHEPAMLQLKALMTASDSEVYSDDCVEIMLGDDRGAYYHLVINSLGTVYDAQKTDKSWNSGMKAAVSREKGAWVVETAIPLAVIKQKISATKMLNFNLFRTRYAGGRPEYSSWSVVERSFHAPERFWRLRFAG